MKAVTSDVNFPQMEREILQRWQDQQAFETSVARRKACPEFTFYDGPPFANGLPHYGHLLQSTIKDVVPRYWTMRGYFVERRFGWDCHGVPVEYEIEKTHNLKGTADIHALGVDKFNELCRSSVMHYAKEWQHTISRLGRWVDWNDQYRTMDKNFMESVWWVLSQLHAKGLLYRDFKVVPYSPRITAVLSNFEANQNYKDVQDPAITVKFKLKDEDASLLAWTTTPWTLISNLALCVGPDIDYVKVRDKETSDVYYLAEARLPYVFKKKKGEQSEPYEILSRVKGQELKGWAYEPLFPYFAEHARSFRVLVDSYVSTEDGTGIVHQAPAFGEDDFRVCREAGIELVDPVDEDGKFKAEIKEHAGQFIKDADKDIIRRLKDAGRLLRNETIFHSYPFCERTDTPLIYKAVKTWYVAVEKIKDRLVANNQKINWVPSHLRDGRMGKWLENARDWAISRNRYWGTPLPIWVSDQDETYFEVIGSVAELERKTGRTIEDLHTHFIDDLTYPAPQGKGTMRRVSEVFDCWFESGAMPYAQLHYPFENQERFPQRFPADFIAEAIDQTRGWFYTLSVLSTALFDQPAFKNVICTGMILASDGKKMSKRLKNYTSPDELLERLGSDSGRLFMLNSPVLKAGELWFSDTGVRETTRAVLLPLWNAYSFLSTYAQADNWQPDAALAEGEAPKVSNELDRWIISRLQTLCRRVNEQMESYHLFAVVPPVLDFIEELTNWYIRLSRKRFWGTDSDETPGGERQGQIAADTLEAYRTLYYVLSQFVKVFAPFAPFTAERLWLNMTEGLAGLSGSVHWCDMPLGDESLIDRGLEDRMGLVRRATNLGRSLRAKHQIKTRQVLPSMLIITRHDTDRSAIENGAEIIKNELNLKEISFTTDEAQFVRLALKPNLKTLGKRLGPQLNEMRRHLETLNTSHAEVAKLFEQLDAGKPVTILGHELTEADFLIERGPKDERLIATDRGVTVLLDTRLTEDLILEGLARELVSRVQKLRKDSGLEVSDRIKLQVSATGRIAQVVQAHNDYIARETLAVELSLETSMLESGVAYDLDGETFQLKVQIVNPAV